SFEATQKANLQNIKDARISANAKLKTSDLGLDFDGYGTFKKSYFKINKADGEPPLDKSLLGKWVVVDTSGGDASLADSLSIMQDVYDPNYAMLGDYIFGNFTPTQREELEKYVLGSKLYSYDPAKVTKSKRDGQAVYVYKVKTDGKKLLDYNKKVAAMMGIGADKLDTVTMFLDTQEVAMEVSIKDEQLVHVTLDAGSVTYSGWNTTTLPQEPKPDLTFKQFNDAADAGISQPTNVSQPSSHSSSSQEADDTERETDINSLKAQIEMVYANYGYYPTLAQINNAGWRSTHMALLQADSLQDPSGKNSTLKASPAKGSYAYEVTAADGLSTCDNVKTYCDDYVLTAVLSDGTPYSQKSLNSDIYGGSTFSE
ncbi:MAG TPA: hypothetical protein VFL85_05170, partial [Candidatus Saccharimonadales bacterium]|nr:hypothetical protein [Candidatus Saccharimonadales bacterium]